MNVELATGDRVISDFLHSIGPWHHSVVIGGGYALFIYKLYFADQEIGNPPVGTQDLDSLLPRKIPEASTKNIANHLVEAGFKPKFKNYDNPPTTSYSKIIEGLDVEVEFLTDTAWRGNKNKNVLIAGVSAVPLSYLTLSLQCTLKFKTSEQETGLVVSPGAWMLNKGLVFSRRASEAKMAKDLYGIWYVATQLGSFSTNAIAELKTLGKQHPKWFDTFRKNLHRWIETQADWVMLEMQDPFKKLRQRDFEALVQTLLNI